MANESLVLIDAHGSVMYLDRTHAISFTVGEEYDLQKRHVSPRIFNALGEEIASLLDGTVEGESGSVNWNAGQLSS